MNDSVNMGREFWHFYFKHELWIMAIVACFYAFPVDLMANPDLGETKVIVDDEEMVSTAEKSLPRIRSRERLIQNVEDSWEWPSSLIVEEQKSRPVNYAHLRDKIAHMMIPKISFDGVHLSQAANLLSQVSEEYDSDGIGINIIVVDPDQLDPELSMTLRNLSLRRILDVLTETVSFDYDIEDDVIVIRKALKRQFRLETDFFPMSRSTLIRLTGLSQQDSGAERAVDSSFWGGQVERKESSTPDEEDVLKLFLEKAGVPFRGIEGANLALADGQLIVTQTPKNLWKIREILRRYNEVKQVQIEARFLEVQEGNLEELGFNWSALGGGSLVFNEDGSQVYDSTGNAVKSYDRSVGTVNRGLSGAFGSSSTDSSIHITGLDSEVSASGSLDIPVSEPLISNAIDTGSGVADLADFFFSLGNYDLNMVIRALSRQSGNDLLSAPKITVLSGKTAEITVAQEMRYPRSYGDVDASVGRGSSDDGVNGSVAVTAATPRDFDVRNVGVEMQVTPLVEEDNSISLRLEPKVTEFEGFVEFGSPSVAISGGQTVTVPSGFYQPVFSVRKMKTEVTIWDGATVVMGGLTREQVVSVEDKVPLLGDIPLLGRLFRSKGESNQKKNLLIFVTANLVNPGGQKIETRNASPSQPTQH